MSTNNIQLDEEEDLQTEIEIIAEDISDTHEGAVLTAEVAQPQTEIIPEKKPRRRKKTNEISTQSGTEDGAGAVGTIIIDAPKSNPADSRSRQEIVAIDSVRSVETEADKSKNDLLDLLESLKTGKVLAGTIQGVERATENKSSFAVLYHGEFKVLIPAEEAVEPPFDYRDRQPEDVHHYLLTKRLGAEVDYVIKGIDSETGVAKASRLDAMRAKRKQYYFGTDRDGHNIVYPGVCAEARVVSVIRSGIFVEIFGVESYIPLRELSYQRTMDATGYFQPGQRILVKVLEINKESREDISVKASVKQATKNPYEKALKKYSIGNRYVGTVSMVDINGVFVALDGGIDCLCSYPKRGRPPRGARVTVRVLGINHETNRVWGAITHIATPR